MGKQEDWLLDGARKAFICGRWNGKTLVYNEWNKLQEELTHMADSRPDTYEHIHQLQTIMMGLIADLMWRAVMHDRPKLFSPEREAYDGLDERLRQHEYGSEEYRAVLREIKPAISHHYQHTKHHPESHERGIRGMNLLDLLEMVCDWKAASMRQGNQGSVRDSLDHNQERFGFGDELKEIILNTIDRIER